MLNKLESYTVSNSVIWKHPAGDFFVALFLESVLDVALKKRILSEVCAVCLVLSY